MSCAPLLGNGSLHAGMVQQRGGGLGLAVEQRLLVVHPLPPPLLHVLCHLARVLYRQSESLSSKLVVPSAQWVCIALPGCKYRARWPLQDVAVA